jgi:UDP-4-amino-4,6-dideoxy-N-acetyl-beta-L-altrosamine N-acetyltransferase
MTAQHESSRAVFQRGGVTMRNPYLIGAHVYLRPVEPDEAPRVVTWFNDPEVTRHIHRYRPVTVAEEMEFLQRIRSSETDLVLGVIVRETDELIGTTGLHYIDPRNRHASFGISIGEKQHWGKGYGTEATGLIIRHAFQTLNLNRLWLHVYEFNARAIRVYEKLGFQVEGRLRQDTFREGRYWDTLVMGVLREELESVDY